MNKIIEIFKAFSIAFNPNDEQAELASKRIEICNKCEFKHIIDVMNISRCSVCGCALSGKIYTPKVYSDDGGSCPKGKWENIEREWLINHSPSTYSKTNSFTIADYVTEYSSYDGITYQDVIIPVPNESNNYLKDRISTSLIVNCGSTWDIRIKNDNTNMEQYLILQTKESATFVFNGEKWMLTNKSTNER
jgi:hypothetical protein